MLQSDSLSHDLLTAYRPSQDLIGIPLMLRLSMLTQPESLEIEKPSRYPLSYNFRMSNDLAEYL